MTILARLLLAMLCLTACATAQAREVTDMLGRKVNVPDRIARVYGAAPPITALIHAIAPEMLVGVNFAFQEEDKAFLPARTAALPVLGGVFGMGRQANPESILAAAPDVALAWKSAFIDTARIEGPFKSINLPLLYIQLDTLADWPPALEFVGRLLGREARGRELAAYVRQAMARVDQAVGGIPESGRVRVYYAESPDGFATDCHRSFHTEAIELAGGYNVFRCEPKEHMGMERVSAEQILLFSPRIILAQDRAFLASYGSDSRWQQVPAVRAGKVVAIPRSPFNWLDRPPSYMRALGILWLANLFYPDRLPLDIRAETKRFYRLFLAVDLSDADVERILHPSNP